MNLEERIKKWVVLDNNHKRLNQQIKLLRDEKNNLTDDIIYYFNEKNIKPSIKISDGMLNLVETKHANLISYKFLEECFNEYFKNNEEIVEALINFIKEKRVYTTSQTIKRNYREKL